jgi:hypothetical protein
MYTSAYLTLAAGDEVGLVSVAQSAASITFSGTRVQTKITALA